MDLKSYLVILRGNIWIILTTLIVTVVIATAITFMIIPTYIAKTTLRVATASSGAVGYSDYMYADRLMNTYTKLATSRPVLQELATKLNLRTIPQIKVELIPNTELIRISVESQNPSIAQTAADSLAEIMIVKGKELYSGGGESAQAILGDQLKQSEDELNQARQDYYAYVSQYPRDLERIAAMDQALQLKEKTYATLLDQYDQARLKEMMRANIISVVEPAVLPSSPSKPNKALNISLGIVVGLVGGVGLAFLFENLYGTRLYTSKQIEAITDLPTIGKIPIMEQRRLLNRKKHGEENFNFPFYEAFRRLHVQLVMQKSKNQDGNPFRSFVITSSEPGEGKSMITSNLAKAISRSGKKVIVVDCDMHIPQQHKLFGLSNGEGLSTLLEQPKNIEEVVKKTRYSGLFVLTSGPLPAEPAKMLGGTQMNSLIKWLSQHYDVVLLDSPAFLAVADTAHLAPIVDGVVLVVRRNFIREEAVKEAYKQLLEINAPLVGLVVNEAERNGTYYYYGHK